MSKKPTQEQPRDLAQEVYNWVKQELRSGSLKAGMRITETDLSNRFSISRTPVREALYLLERDGLITYEARRGIVVTRLDQQMISELYTMREHEESLAASLAAQHASDIEIATLGELIDLEEEEIATAKSTNLLNQRIHGLIATAAHNRFLSRNLGLLNGTLCLLPTMLEDKARALEAHQQHRDILSAIRRRDSEAAGEAAAAHIRSAYRLRLRQFLDSTRED